MSASAVLLLSELHSDIVTAHWKLTACPRFRSRNADSKFFQSFQVCIYAYPRQPAALGAAGLPEPSDPAPARASQPRPPGAARRRRRRRHFLPLAVASFPLSGYSIHLGPEPPAPHRAAPRPLPPAPAETAQRPARPQPALGPRRRRTAAWRIPPASRRRSAPPRSLAPRPHESRPVIGRSAEVKG